MAPDAPEVEESEADFAAFLAGVDRALTEQFGPDHQAILGTAGRVVAQFEW